MHAIHDRTISGAAVGMGIAMRISKDIDRPMMGRIWGP